MHSTIEHAPDHVRARLGAQARETRSYHLSRVEFRDGEDEKSWLFTGCASVFDTGYEMYGGPPYGWIEYVDSGSCDKTLAERCDTLFLINHRDMPLARTKSGTLRLSADSGLGVEADLDPMDPDVIRVRPKLRRRDMDEMSFAFGVLRQEWNDDYTERHIRELSLHKGDVSLVNFGANDSTWANDLRSAVGTLAELSHRSPDRLALELRDAAGGDPVVMLSAARDAIDQALRSMRPVDLPAAVERSIALDDALYL